MGNNSSRSKAVEIKCNDSSSVKVDPPEDDIDSLESKMEDHDIIDTDLAEKLKEAHMNAVGKADYIIPQNIIWQINTGVKEELWNLDQAKFQLRLFLEPTPVDSCTKLCVELMTLRWTHHCLTALYFNFGPNDVLGHYFDVLYGQKIDPDTSFTVGEVVVKDLYNRTVSIAAFNPNIESSNGSINTKLGPISHLVRNSRSIFSRTLRGPTFYTSLLGYRVKFELEYNKKIEAKITFLSGKYDHVLQTHFQHVINIVICHQSGDKHLIKSGIHDIANEKWYKYSLGSRKRLEADGFIKDDFVEVHVSIKSLYPVLVPPIPDSLIKISKTVIIPKPGPEVVRYPNFDERIRNVKLMGPIFPIRPINTW